MNVESFVGVARFGIETAMLVSAPVLIFGLIAGIAISVFQAATQINDAALAFIPKIVAAVVALSIFGPWMMSRMAAFATYCIGQIPNIGN